MIGNGARRGGDATLTAFDVAQASVICACRPLAIETIALAHAAGRILAQDVIAAEDLVPFARSAMDGFAVRARDVRALPARLPVKGGVFAAPGESRLAEGSACAIATGAPLPAGADAVIPIEHVELVNGSILVTRRVSAGASVFPPGDDARSGEILLAGSAQLTPAALGLLAAAGESRVGVFRRPTIAVVCGGDELVPIEAQPGFGQVRNSNGHLLAALADQAGATALPPICVRDTRSAVRAALADALERADLVVTTGGASVGERDFIKSVCAELGVEFLFGAVALRPAKPTAFGRRGDRFIAVLPGNPAAAFVAFMEFVRPAIRALGGYRDVRLPRIAATLAGTINAKANRHFAAFAALTIGADGFVATPLENQCSSLTRTAVEAAAFIVVPPGARTYRAGDRVEVDVFDWEKAAAHDPGRDTLPERTAFALR